MTPSQPPSGALGLADRVAAASRSMARVTGVLIIVIMIAVVIDAVLRGILGIAIWGVLEVGVLLLLALIYLGLPATQANRENFRVSIFAERFPPWVDRIVTWLLLAVQIGVLGVLCGVMGNIQATESIGLSLLIIQSLMAALEYALIGRHPYKVDIETELKGEIGKTDTDLVGERR